MTPIPVRMIVTAGNDKVARAPLETAKFIQLNRGILFLWKRNCVLVWGNKNGIYMERRKLLPEY